MIYDFDTPIERRATDSEKWGKYAEDVIPMWVADMDFRSPQPVIQALHQRIEHGVFGYPDGGFNDDPNELKKLRQLVVERLFEKYCWKIHPEDMIFIPGVVVGLNLSCHTHAVPGDSVLVQPPVYFPILKVPENSGMQRQENELRHNPDGSYDVDMDAFEATMNEQTRLFILCNPHNPVGRVYRRDELERMAEICLRHRIAICSDEIHCDLLYSGQKHIPIASLDPEIAQNTITLIAPTKTYNIPGLQGAIAVIPNSELRRKFLQAGLGLNGWTNLLGLVAMRTAYQHGQEWLEQLLVYLERNRNYLFDYVQAELPSINMVMPEGTYLAWLDCRGSVFQDDPYRAFLTKAKVALGDGRVFGTGGRGFVRLNYACPKSTLIEGLNRMKVALKAASQSS